MPRRGEWAWRRPLSISGTSERCLDVSPESTMRWDYDVFVSWTWGRPSASNFAQHPENRLCGSRHWEMFSTVERTDTATDS